MPKGNLIDEQLTGSIIGAFYEVYNDLGYGFLEHLYCNALEQELRDRGHQVGREVGVSVYFKGRELGQQRLDMLVDGRVVVEVKSTLTLHRDPARQLFNYLRATNLNVGLFLHFGREANVQRVICSKKHHAITARSARSAESQKPRTEWPEGEA